MRTITLNDEEEKTFVDLLDMTNCYLEMLLEDGEDGDEDGFGDCTIERVANLIDKLWKETE